MTREYKVIKNRILNKAGGVCAGCGNRGKLGVWFRQVSSYPPKNPVALCAACWDQD